MSTAPAFTAIATPNASAISSFVALLLRRVDVRGDSAVTLPCDAGGDRNQLSRLRVKMRRLGGAIAQLGVAAHGLGCKPAELSDATEQLLSVPFPIEHHLVTTFLVMRTVPAPCAGPGFADSAAVGRRLERPPISIRGYCGPVRFA